MKKRSPRIVIFFTIFVDLLGFGIVVPLMAPIADNYVAADGMAGKLMIGALMASFSLCQMIFAPMWGRLSDRHGRRPILLLSLFGSTASYALFGLARNYETLLFARIFAGICGANLVAAQAYIADVTEPEKRTSAMGLIGMAFGLGFALGPVFGAGMSKVGEWFTPGVAAQTWPGLTAAAICGTNLLWAMFRLPESLPAEMRGKATGHAKRFASVREFAGSLVHQTVGPLVAVFFLSTLAFANMEVSLGLYVKRTDALGIDPENVYNVIYGIFIYIGVLLAFMHGYVVRKMVKFIPETVLVIIGVLAQAVALLVFPLVPSLTCILIAMAILCFGQGISVPALLAVVSQSTTPDKQGHVMGVTQSASSLARILGPIVAMSLWGVLDLRLPFFVGSAIMVGAVAMAVVTRSRILAQPLDGLSVEDLGTVTADDTA